ncbi:MAG: tyrosine-type recombinase/integrase [Prevotella sp.]
MCDTLNPNRQLSVNQVLFSMVVEAAYAKAIKKSVSTQRNYRTAVVNFDEFLGYEDIPVDNLSPKLIEDFAEWLKNGGLSDNTVACYMKKLRAILNEYFKGEKDFGYLFYGVKTKMSPTKKKAIRELDLMKLLSYRAENDKEELVIDIARFQFLAMGMPFVDIANLKIRDIKNGYFEYRRHKTGVTVRVSIKKELATLINKYKTKANGRYLFPIINDEGDNFSCQAHRSLVRYNYQLKKICKKLGIPAVTSYVIRHSWASYAYQEDVKLPVISKALGHTQTFTTLTYIKGPDDDKVAEANSIVLSRFKGIFM